MRFVLSVLALVLISACPVYADALHKTDAKHSKKLHLDGWVLERVKGKSAYLSRELAGHRIELFISHWSDNTDDNLKKLQAIETRKTYFPERGKLKKLTPHKPKRPDRPNYHRLRNHLISSGEFSHRSMFLVCSNGKRFRWFEAIGPKDAFEGKAYTTVKAAVARARNHACSERASTAVAQVKKSAPSNRVTRKAKSVAPKSPKTKSIGLQPTAIWLVGYWITGYNGGMDYVEKPWITFSDGKATGDLRAVIEKGVTSARKSQKNWAPYRVKKGKIQLKRKGRWGSSDGTIKLTAGGKGMKLNGCWLAKSGVFFTGIAEGSTAGLSKSNRWCFKRNGTFSNAKSSSFNANSSSGGGAGGSRKTNSGRYFVDGFTIQLTYGNGRKVKSPFAWKDMSGSSNGDDFIFIGGSLLLPSSYYK